MKKWYEENYVSRRNWILENLYKLNLTPEETIIVMMIDYYNEFGKVLSIDSLAESTGLPLSVIDRDIAEISRKGYLNIVAKNRKVHFDISGIFEEKKEELSKDLFELFEDEFGRVLSQMETTLIAEWLNKYGEKTVKEALREASIQQKVDFRYIDKILAAWSK